MSLNDNMTLFDLDVIQKPSPNSTIIRSVSEDQHQIIQWIKDLYCPWGIDLDPTYSTGNFYKKTENPKLMFDICPVYDYVKEANCTNLPLENESVRSIMFDPPFVGGSRKDGKPGIIKTRFSYYKNIPLLWEMYASALKEFYRILLPSGILIFKCQDSIEYSKQYFTEFKVIKEALALGFYPKDKFILTTKTRIISPNQLKQQHSRKFHSYFLVFIKTKPLVNY